MFRTVRSTISPSSAIQRRCQLPQPNNTATAATPIHRLPRTTVSYGNTGRLIGLATGRRGSVLPATPIVSALSFVLAEGNSGTDCSDPCQCQQLQHPVTQRDVFGLAGQTAVDVDRITQDRDGERDHRHREPGPRVVVTLERP